MAYGGTAVRMVRGLGAGSWVAVLALFVAAGLTSIPGVELRRDSPAPPRRGILPAWNDDRLRQCNYDCQDRHWNDGDAFNRCYACRCLLLAAESEGEVISALAQCEQATEEDEER